MNRKGKRLVSVALCLLLSISSMPAFASPRTDDLQGHWAEKQTRKWIEKGLASGTGGGKFEPDRGVARGEFAKLVNTVFGFKSSKSSAFTDVDSNAWYGPQAAAALEAGFMSGYPDGSFKPQAVITRQEAAKAVAGLFHVPSAGEQVLDNYRDQADVQSYARASLASLLSAGYLKGYADGSLQPSKAITRAEAVTLLDRLAGEVLNTHGTATLGETAGSVLINTTGVRLKDTVINGNILLTAGIGEGDAWLEKVTVKKAVYVGGGGPNSIHIADSRIQSLVGDHPKSKVRVVISGDSEIQNASVGSNMLLELDQNAKIDSLVVEEESEAAAITAKGTIGSLKVLSASVLINDSRIEKGAELAVKDGVVMKADGTPLKPQGSSSSVYVSGGGSLSIPPQLTPAASGNIAGSSIAITFPDNAAWRGAIRSITAGGKAVSAGNYTIAPGVITLHAPVFERKGDYAIEVNASGYNKASVTQKMGEWKLSWNDEFDGNAAQPDTNGVDLTKWGYQEGTGSQYGLDGWGNNEQQYYRKENIKVEGGKLLLNARKEAVGGKNYTSGRLYTEPTFSQTYGRFEAKIKLPAGQGLWPAFWMMPKDSEYGTWASSGELDIMEVRGRLPGEVDGTIHFGKQWPNNKSAGASYHFKAGTDITDEHVYAVEWEPGEIRWYVDGELYQTQNNWDSTGANQPAKFAYPAPFDKPFYMILNLAIGGNYDNGVMPTDDLLPATMEVDYVRVYELDGIPYRTPQEPVVVKEPLPEGVKQPIDGNLVYDPSYSRDPKAITQPNVGLDPQYWNFVTIDTFGGSGTITKDQVDGKPFAKIDISNSGNAAHAIQLIQNVTLGKGRWYKLSFDAKSDSSRNLAVKLGGGETRGWSSYSDTLEAKLGTAVQSYELVFQMMPDTDVLARLEFNLGLNRSPVWIGNVKLVETEETDPFREDAPKEPLNGNHVYNGKFNLGRMDRMTYWKLETDTGTAASAAVKEGQLHIAINKSGSEPGSIRLVQNGIQLIEENDYQLTFKAKADTPRSIRAALQQEDGTAAADMQKLALTTEWQDVTANFTTAAGGNDSGGKLVFQLGGEQAGLAIEDIRLIRLTDNHIGELPLEEQFPLKNGDFSAGKTNWSEHVQGRYDGYGSKAELKAEDGEMRIGIDDEGNNPWDIMLMQNDFPLHKGQVYVVSADLKSTAERGAEIVVDAENHRYVSEHVNLTKDWQTFSYELPVTADLTTSFKLLLGKLEGAAQLNAHEVSVRQVRVELKDARTKAFPLRNGDFTDGMNGWSRHVQGDYEGDSSAVIEVVNGGLKAAIESHGVNPWDVMLIQEPVQLYKDKTYILSFDARSTMPRDIEVAAENNSYHRYLNWKVQLDSTTQTYHSEFTPDKDDITGLKFLLGKPAEGVPGAHDVWFDNIRLEVKGAKEAAGEKVKPGNDISLPAAPSLTSDAADNAVGYDIDITFTDNAAWRQAIRSVLVNNEAVEPSSYKLSSGKLTLDYSLFPEAGSYRIIVRADGYEQTEVAQQIEEKVMWSLVWQDEFDGSGDNLDTNGVDLDKWGYQQGTGSDYGLVDWGNNEQQYYRKENIKVQDGKLILEAKGDGYGGKSYTSGRLFTADTFTKAYGKFEARMKLPAGQGLWPAFWMMPKDSEYGVWASSGELDIMEARGRLPGEVDGTIHYGKQWPNNKSTGASYKFPAGESFETFHTYGVEWEPGEIRWYVDGQLYQTVNDWYSWEQGQPDKYAYPAPFDRPFYMIMNLAVGGMYDGNRLPDPSVLPARMEVDYVRVYELTGRDYLEPAEPVIVKEPIPDNGKPEADGNLLYDLNFEHGITDIASLDTPLHPLYWNFLHTSNFGGAGSVNIDTIEGKKFAKATITSGGNAAHALQLIQYATLVKGRIYELSFDAKAAAARSISVKFGGDDDNGWAAYSDNFDVPLKDTVQRYTYRFVMEQATDLTARLEYNLGLNTNAVWIGNAVLREVDVLSEPNAAKEPLDNGNHIYNGSFDLGTVDRMKYWELEQSGSASALAAVDPVRRQLELNIKDGGSAIDSVRLIQKGLQLLQNDEYKLTFDAKALTPRTIGVKLLNRDGSVVYLANEAVMLDTNMSQRELVFTVPPNETERQAVLVFELGGANSTLTLDNVKLIRTTNHNVDYSGVELFPLDNGDFSAGLTGWVPFTQGAAAAFTAEDGVAKIAIANAGSEAWNVMLMQENLPLSKGMTYVLSFRARSTAARDMEAVLENASYTRRFDSGSIQVTGDWKTYHYEFKMAADDSVTFKLLLGKTAHSPAGAHDLFIDDVVLEVKNAPVKRPPTLMTSPEGALAGQTVELRFADHPQWRTAVSEIWIDGNRLESGQFEVLSGMIRIAPSAMPVDKLYRITVKASGFADVTIQQQVLASDGNLVLNGGFARGTADWEHWMGEGGDSKFAVEDGAARMDIYYHGGLHPQWGVPVSWSTQLMQSGIKLEAGKSYELSFRAWSSADRPFLVELGGYNSNQQDAFSLTGDASAVFTKSMQPARATTLSLKFLLGNVIEGGTVTPDEPHTIFIDDVSIKEVKAPPVLAADQSDNKLGQHIELEFADLEAWRQAIEAVILDGVPVPADKIHIEAGKITLDSSLFSKAKSYSISILASGYGPAEITQEIRTDAANVALHKTASASSARQAAANAFDGNSGTRWESDPSDPQWIAVDLGRVHVLESVVLHWEGAFAKAYNLQVSSAASPSESDWTDIYSETNGSAGLKRIELNGEEARHVRLLGTARGTEWGYSLWEFEVYGKAAGPALKSPPALIADDSNNRIGQPMELVFPSDTEWEHAVQAVYVNGSQLTAEDQYTLISGKLILSAELFLTAGSYTITVEADGYDPAEVIQPVTEPQNLALRKPVAASSGLNPQFVTDGDSGSRWEADWQRNELPPFQPEWIYIDLESTQTLESIRLVWETAYARALLIQTAPESSDLSADSADWQTVQSLDRTLAVNGKFTETVLLNNAEGRYVRIYMTAKGLEPYGPSLYEVELF